MVNVDLRNLTLEALKLSGFKVFGASDGFQEI